MLRSVWLTVVLLGALTSVSAVAHAQCTMDVDCKGERVCERGECRMPAELPPAPSSPENADAPALDAAPPRASMSEPPSYFFDDEDTRPKPKKRIGKPGMMVAGIVLVSSAPIVLVAGVLSTSCNRDTTDSCDVAPRLLGFTAASLILIGAGVPLIVIGAKRVPVARVSAVPWVGRRDAGLQLLLDM
jgi:hypothetical protein